VLRYRAGRVGEALHDIEDSIWLEDTPASAAFQNCPTPMPIGDATPKPVTTTRGVTVDLS
jgi:hypothetical protein